MAPAEPLRLALVPDFLEEGWPSMDLAAEMLEASLRGRARVQVLRPAFRRRLGPLARLPGRAGRVAFNADRLLNRFWDYPRWLRRAGGDADVYHVCDHSYAQLIGVLPAERTGVYLHDLDTFRCLLEPHRDRRPRWFRAMARRTLDGLQRAAVVFHSTAAVRADVERFQLVDVTRLVAAPLGVAPEFVPAGPPAEVPGPYVLHVGSMIPRKRIDLLLEVFAAVAARRPDLRLVQVGGPWTDEQARAIARLGIAPRLVKASGVSRARLAALYRDATLVLIPSDDEGFGLPLVEALACGSAVVASDLPALREVGGAAAVFLRRGDLRAWSDGVAELLSDPARLPALSARLARAGEFSWSSHGDRILAAYERLVRA